MTVEVSMVAKTAKDAIVVPAGAVFKTDEGANYVLLAGSDAKAHQKKVQVGIRNTEMAQVLSGINAGDAVIVSGGYAVPDGTKVEIAKPGAEEKEGADADDKAGDKKDAKDAKNAKDSKDDQKNAKASTSAKPDGKEKE
jgi:F0F1-type ATP synthase epsilon subunit